MNLHQKRVQNVQHFFENKDVFLGFRRLLDVAMDTQDMNIYKRSIELTDWKESHPNSIEELCKKSLELLQQVAQIEVKPVECAQAVIEAKDIQKKYGHNSFGLGPVSLAIKKSEIYGLVGENGNGKTTLLRVLAKELQPTSGLLKFYFSEKPKNTYDLRTKLAYVPQRPNKWYGSLLDNLRFVLASYHVKPDEVELRVLMMIARLGLWKYRNLQWSQLSSGYKMRFELARTLLRKPEVLLLDEPLANLDIMAQQVVLEDLKSIAMSLNHPIALILSSQQLYEVEKVSDEVIFLKNGKYQDLKSNELEPSAKQLIVELDVKATREQIEDSFKELDLHQLSFNGGVYVASFPSGVTFSKVLTVLAEKSFEVTYVRNISASTRRFFIN